VEVLDDFKRLITFKIDLSDPNPQLATFRFHYTRIPAAPAVPPSTTTTPFVSQSMAALILLSALPLSSDPLQDSVYQRMMEDYTAAHTVPNMDLDTLTESIRNTWASRFGHLPETQKPKKGTFYIPKKDKAPPKKLQANVTQKTSAIKDKPTPPAYLDQFKTGSTQDKGQAHADTPGPSSRKPADKKRNRRPIRGKRHAHHALIDSHADYPHFEITHPALTPSLLERINAPLTPSPEPHSEHTVASFQPLGGLTIRTAKEQKPWKAPGCSPYPVFHKAKSLADRIGATSV